MDGTTEGGGTARAAGLQGRPGPFASPGSHSPPRKRGRTKVCERSSGPGDSGERGLAARRGEPPEPLPGGQQQRAAPALSAWAGGGGVCITYTAGPRGSGRSARQGCTAPSCPHTSSTLEKSHSRGSGRTQGWSPGVPQTSLHLSIPSRAGTAPHPPPSPILLTVTGLSTPTPPAITHWTSGLVEGHCSPCTGESPRGQRN